MKAESFSEYGWRGVGTTSRKKQTCHCARVKYMTESRQEGRLVYCSFHSLGFEILLLSHVLKELTVVVVVVLKIV